MWSKDWWEDFKDDHPRVGMAVRKARSILPPLNFITIHYGYFVGVCLIASGIMYGSSDSTFHVSYVDSLFIVVSAMTEAGLNTVNLSELTTWQQALLFLLILFGSSIWVSIWTVFARKRAFEKRFHAIVKAEELRRQQQRAAGNNLSLGLPLRRIMSGTLRKTTSAPAPGATSPRLPTTGSRIGYERQSVSRDGPIGDGASQEQPPNIAAASSVQQGNGEAARRGSRPSPGTNGHVAFAEDRHPNDDGSNAGQRHNRDLQGAAETSGSSIYVPESRLSRRNVADAGPASEKAYFPADDFHAHNFLTTRTVGRNGQFHNLSIEERESLGGCEYRALRLLSWLVPLYFFSWQILGCVALGAWIHLNQPETPRENGIEPFWLGIFNGVSAFNNSGMSLLDANMIPFENAYFVLITMGAMILAGNTAYPLLLRLILWTSLKTSNLLTQPEDFADTKATIEFILKYPRRVYTNLFPSRQTWWLLFMLALLNSIDWAAFELLNLGNPVIEDIPRGSRVLDGLFQALAVRSGGFYVVPISQVYVGLQVLYVIMMYISVYPVVITMRHSNVYEERSLGIYAEDQRPSSDIEDDPSGITMTAANAEGGPGPTLAGTTREFGAALLRAVAPWHGVGVPPPASNGNESRVSFISHQVHGQLAHDMWLLVLAVLVISTIETSHWLGDPLAYSVFNVIFEVTSAYGTVGISTGVPFNAFSFSGGWHSASKLVLCLVMLRGRHRGLPVALDRAVRLPGEQVDRDEEEDHRIRRSMTAGRRRSVDTC